MDIIHGILYIWPAAFPAEQHSVQPRNRRVPSLPPRHGSNKADMQKTLHLLRDESVGRRKMDIVGHVSWT